MLIIPQGNHWILPAFLLLQLPKPLETSFPKQRHQQQCSWKAKFYSEKLWKHGEIEWKQQQVSKRSLNLWHPPLLILKNTNEIIMTANDIEGSRRQEQNSYMQWPFVNIFIQAKKPKRWVPLQIQFRTCLIKMDLGKSAYNTPSKRIKKKRHISAYIFPKLFFAYAPPSWPAYINNDPECFSETCRNFQVE